MITLFGDLITILSITLWLWILLGCICYKKAIERYVNEEPYQRFLLGATACFSTLTSVPFLQTIAANFIGKITITIEEIVPDLLVYLVYFALVLLFWFWTYLLLVEGLSIADALYNHEPYRLNPFLVFALCVIAYTMFSTFLYFGWVLI